MEAKEVLVKDGWRLCHVTRVHVTLSKPMRVTNWSPNADEAGSRRVIAFEAVIMPESMVGPSNEEGVLRELMPDGDMIVFREADRFLYHPDDRDHGLSEGYVGTGVLLEEIPFGWDIPVMVRRDNIDAITVDAARSPLVLLYPDGTRAAMHEESGLEGFDYEIAFDAMRDQEVLSYWEQQKKAD